MSNFGQYILIIDDNLENLEFTAKTLKDDGFLISLAQDAQTALIELDQLIPDLILLDIMMPEIDGIELCRIIKKNEKLAEIPVIFLTAKSQAEDLAEGFKAGAVDYINKPFNRLELLVRVKNHIELSLSRKKILEMNKTRDKLYSIIAHDIRSPLSGIDMTINAIADGYLKQRSDDFTEMVTHLKKTITETIILLENLLTWTKLHNQNLLLSAEVQNIYPIILECVQLFKGNANNKKITINVDATDEIKAYFDEISIHVVLRNLIFNAIKFTPENGTINIYAQNISGFVQISVKDTGVGISEDVIGKLLKNQEYFTTTGTNKEQGSGLGLLLCKEFVEKHGGKIWVESEVGKGSDFKFTLPMCTEQAKGINN